MFAACEKPQRDRLDLSPSLAIMRQSTTPSTLDMLALTKNPEVWIVESFETGLCDVYDNPKAAQEHVEEMNRECPDDHYWFYPRPLRSK